MPKKIATEKDLRDIVRGGVGEYIAAHPSDDVGGLGIAIRSWKYIYTRYGDNFGYIDCPDGVSVEYIRFTSKMSKLINELVIGTSAEEIQEFILFHS